MWVAHALDVDCPCNYENNVDGISIPLEDFTNLIIYIFVVIW
jgi:hypothetical protein